MKRLIIAQVKIELDSDKSDYANANIDSTWSQIVADHLDTNSGLIRGYCSIQIDEKKE